MTHVKCLKKQSLNRSVSLWVYEGVVRKAIVGLKYKYAYQIAEELAGWSASSLKQKLPHTPKIISWLLYHFIDGGLIGVVLTNLRNWEN